MDPETPETLSADELAYHQTLTAQLKTAQAAWQSWSGHLAARYRLVEGDGIAESGEVVRAEPPPRPVQVPREDAAG